MGDQPQSPDLLGMGTRCSCVGCNQLDFLPFSCSSCGSMFCGEHRYALAPLSTSTTRGGAALHQLSSGHCCAGHRQLTAVPRQLLQRARWSALCVPRPSS